jgi:hypothetical protein
LILDLVIRLAVITAFGIVLGVLEEGRGCFDPVVCAGIWLYPTVFEVYFGVPRPEEIRSGSGPA